VISHEAVVVLAALAVVLSTASCNSDRGVAASAPPSSAAASQSVTSGSSIPPGSAPATPRPPSNAAPYAADSGATLGVGSATPSAIYQARITVTVTSQPDEASSQSSAAATEFEVAHVKIQVQSGTYPYRAENFKYLSVDGNVYPPIAATGVGDALGSGMVSAGRSVQGDIVFRVPLGGGQVQIYDLGTASFGWKTPT